MGRLKSRGHEQVQEYRQQFDELQESAENFAEETERNKEIAASIEGVDDDDKTALEAGKEQGHEIAEGHAEEIDAQKNEINSRMETTVDEMNERANQERTEAQIVGNMDGSYGGIGSNLESAFESSADEFDEIASSGMEIQESSNGAIDGNTRRVRVDW